MGGLKRTDPSFETSSLVGKMLSNSTDAAEELTGEGRIDAANFIVVLFKKLLQPPNLQEPPP